MNTPDTVSLATAMFKTSLMINLCGVVALCSLLAEALPLNNPFLFPALTHHKKNSMPSTAADGCEHGLITIGNVLARIPPPPGAIYFCGLGGGRGLFEGGLLKRGKCLAIFLFI